jgi:hypothetical protein
MNPARGNERGSVTRKRGGELSEIHCRVSFDLHERRNDLGAVSERGSVK